MTNRELRFRDPDFISPAYIEAVRLNANRSTSPVKIGDRITEVVEGRPLIEVLFEHYPEWIDESGSVFKIDSGEIVI